MATTSMVQAGSLWLPSIFSEGMVLQREMPVPVWGRAAPGAEIRVSLITQTGVHIERGGEPLADGMTTACPETGRWQVTLPPMPAGGRHTLLIMAKEPQRGVETMRLFSEVWIGEVWLVCGQSNMIFPMSSCGEDDRADALAHLHKFPNIRFADIGLRRSHEVTAPIEDTEGYWGPAKWETATYAVPRSSTTDVPGSMSGIAYFFARSLSRWLGAEMPVGILVVGAILPVESWVDDAVAAGVPELTPLHGKGYPHATGRAFKANIAPLAPFAIRGVVYGQASMNADRPVDYYHGLKAMIASWRRAWEREDLPFLLVQPPGFIKHLGRETALDMDPEHLAMFNDQNAGHPFCLLREAQLRVSREVPHVGMIVTVDQGEKFEIHPPFQRCAGDRLGLLARTQVYGDSTARGESPRPRAIRRDGDRFRIAFDGTESGLVAHGDLDGFEISNAHGIWHPARAVIDGATVSVQADGVSSPDGVRYAWYGFPPVTLYNANGLPATPFIHPSPTFDIPDARRLWTGGSIPCAADLPFVEAATFHVIKPYAVAEDGFRFQHGVALVWHDGKLFASVGVNRNAENTGGEEARYFVSVDQGASWPLSGLIEAGSSASGLAISHGVFLSHGGTLWAFHGAFHHAMQGVHTRAYRFDAAAASWTPLGTVIEGGFWPLQEPLRLPDGRWIMAGIAVRNDCCQGGVNPPAVAITKGHNLFEWDLVIIPCHAPGMVWGESTVYLEGDRLVNVARYGHEARTLVATSSDGGRTWIEAAPSELPMSPSKPYAGTLSTGAHYLIGAMACDVGHARTPLCIALTRPGESGFSDLRVIRHAVFPDGPGESHPHAALAYPYAIEHDGFLYVGYSNSGGGVGRAGEGRAMWNNNSIELAVMPVNRLA